MLPPRNSRAVVGLAEKAAVGEAGLVGLAAPANIALISRTLTASPSLHSLRATSQAAATIGSRASLASLRFFEEECKVLAGLQAVDGKETLKGGVSFHPGTRENYDLATQKKKTGNDWQLQER